MTRRHMQKTHIEMRFQNRTSEQNFNYRMKNNDKNRKEERKNENARCWTLCNLKHICFNKGVFVFIILLQIR